MNVELTGDQFNLLLLVQQIVRISLLGTLFFLGWRRLMRHLLRHHRPEESTEPPTATRPQRKKRPTRRERITARRVVIDRHLKNKRRQVR